MSRAVGSHGPSRLSREIPSRRLPARARVARTSHRVPAIVAVQNTSMPILMSTQSAPLQLRATSSSRSSIGVRWRSRCPDRSVRLVAAGEQGPKSPLRCALEHRTRGGDCGGVSCPVTGRPRVLPSLVGRAAERLERCCQLGAGFDGDGPVEPTPRTGPKSHPQPRPTPTPCLATPEQRTEVG